MTELGVPTHLQRVDSLSSEFVEFKKPQVDRGRAGNCVTQGKRHPKIAVAGQGIRCP
jgi:hypothetical protein